MRLHVRRSGEGSPSIVFVHGLGMSGATWQAVVDVLAPVHETLAIDLLGHGESPLPEDPAEYTRDAALDDLDQVIASAAGPVVLVGHSFGGGVAVRLAHDHRNRARSLVLVNSVGGSSWRSGRTLRSIAERPLWDWGDRKSTRLNSSH